MLKKLVYNTLKHRHPWRDIGFTELSELYISCGLRSLATGLLLVFVPFFLFQNGYGYPAILAMFGCLFGTRLVADFGAAYMVARFGSKHTMIASCMTQIVSASLFLTVPTYHWPVWLLGASMGIAYSFYFLAYHVQFSKIKHNLHVGKELSYMQIFERLGYVIGPLIGGLTGSFLGSRYIFGFACIVLLASLWPLFRTSEPVKTHQKLYFRKLPIAKLKRDFISYAALGIENTVCINLWPFFVALFVLSGTVYAQLGILASLSVLVSIGAAGMIGRFVDNKNARRLLRWALIVNSLLYVVRPFIGSAPGVLVLNSANEITTTAYRMPYQKGMYGAADDLPGLRIVYIASMESIGNVFKATLWFMLAIMAMVIAFKAVLIVSFVLAGIASLVALNERFVALNHGAGHV